MQPVPPPPPPTAGVFPVTGSPASESSGEVSIKPDQENYIPRGPTSHPVLKELGLGLGAPHSALPPRLADVGFNAAGCIAAAEILAPAPCWRGDQRLRFLTRSGGQQTDGLKLTRTPRESAEPSGAARPWTDGAVGRDPVCCRDCGGASVNRTPPTHRCSHNMSRIWRWLLTSAAA